MANKRRACMGCKDFITQFYGCNECDNRFDGNGYPIILIDGRWVKEYRYVMEKYLGTKLKRGQIIHHIDHDKKNSKIENLVICKDAMEHSRLDHLFNGTLHPYKTIKYKITKDRRVIFI